MIFCDLVLAFNVGPNKYGMVLRGDIGYRVELEIWWHRYLERPRRVMIMNIG